MSVVLRLFEVVLRLLFEGCFEVVLSVVLRLFELLSVVLRVV